MTNLLQTLYEPYHFMFHTYLTLLIINIRIMYILITVYIFDLRITHN